MVILLLKAFVIGFIVSVPVGPIGLIAIQKSISHGFKIGFAVGLGAAIADSTYGFLALSSMAIISKFLAEHIDIIKILGGILIIIFGIIEIIQAQKQKKQSKLKKAGFTKTAISTFFLTISNPIVVFSFIAIFASFGHNMLTLNTSQIYITTIAIVAGSLSWWTILTSVASIIKGKVSKKILHFIKITSSSILIIFGLYAIGLFNIFIKLIFS